MLKILKIYICPVEYSLHLLYILNLTNMPKEDKRNKLLIHKFDT